MKEEAERLGINIRRIVEEALEEALKLLLDASALYPLAKIIADEPRLAERLAEQITILDLTLYEACNAALVEHRSACVGSRRGSQS